MPPIPPDKDWASGRRTVITALITTVVVAFGMGLIHLRLQARQRISDRLILTAAEVRNLPTGTLPVVMARDGGVAENSFNFQLLRLVMERSGRPYSLGLSANTIPQDEKVEALASETIGAPLNPEAITVSVFGAGSDFNQRLRAVPIPVSGGLLGLRVGWMHHSRTRLSGAVATTSDLRKLVLLQGTGWSDVKVFDAAGLRTFTTRPSELLRLVHFNRVDLYPRGITELERELPVVRREAGDAVVDPHLLIAYHFAGFFYVSRNNPALAAAIQTGFRRAMADGSYQRLLDAHLFTPWLRRELNLAKRRVIFLPNPEAAEVLQEVKPEHWIVPWQELASGRIADGGSLCRLPQLRRLCR